MQTSICKKKKFFIVKELKDYQLLNYVHFWNGKNKIK